MIELARVGKTYQVGGQALPVLMDITLTIAAGEFVSIMGPSGSGKSTLMHILGCLDVPTSGEYRLRGRSTASLSGRELATVRNQEIGFVFQNFHLLGRRSALRNVELPLLYASVPRAVRRERATALLTGLGLGNRLHHVPAELSGGQKQRVAIARALANEPALLLADEPTGALDTATGRELLTVLHALNETGVTVVVITHDPQVARTARRIVRLQDGRMVGDETGGAQ